jgi:hypothetical protein
MQSLKQPLAVESNAQRRAAILMRGTARRPAPLSGANHPVQAPEQELRVHLQTSDALKRRASTCQRCARVTRTATAGRLRRRGDRRYAAGDPGVPSTSAPAQTTDVTFRFDPVFAPGSAQNGGGAVEDSQRGGAVDNLVLNARVSAVPLPPTALLLAAGAVLLARQTGRPRLAAA